MHQEVGTLEELQKKQSSNVNCSLLVYFHAHVAFVSVQFDIVHIIQRRSVFEGLLVLNLIQKFKKFSTVSR